MAPARPGIVVPGLPNPRGTVECPRGGGACACRSGWTGDACDEVSAQLRIFVTITPKNPDQRVVFESAGRPGMQVLVCWDRIQQP